jgi:hypothetical protein
MNRPKAVAFPVAIRRSVQHQTGPRAPHARRPEGVVNRKLKRDVGDTTLHGRYTVVMGSISDTGLAIFRAGAWRQREDGQA